jgi:hypothetical protein
MGAQFARVVGSLTVWQDCRRHQASERRKRIITTVPRLTKRERRLLLQDLEKRLPARERCRGCKQVEMQICKYVLKAGT